MLAGNGKKERVTADFLTRKELSPPAQEFTRELLEWRPEWIRYCFVEKSGSETKLIIEIPPPSDSHRFPLVIWEDNDELTIEIGAWHAHGPTLYWYTCAGTQYEEVYILDFMRDIVNGKIQLALRNGEVVQPIDPEDWDTINEILYDIPPTESLNIQTWGGKRSTVLKGGQNPSS